LSIRQYEKLFEAKKLIDIGCGTGEAANIFNGLLKNTDIIANDFSTIAIEQIVDETIAKIVSDFRDIERIYDIVYCSQLLAFYKEDLLTDLIKLTNNMLIIAVPYDQNLEGKVTEPIDGHEPGGHKRSFSRKDFPKFISDFERTTFKSISHANHRIIGSQLLVVYEKIDELTKKDLEFDQNQLDAFYKYLETRI
jgi:SAM-dependent methyltransferase